MSQFVKLDGDMLRSSIWPYRDLRSMFITMLLLAYPEEYQDPIPTIQIRTLDYGGWDIPPGWYGFVPAASIGIIVQDGLADREQGFALLEQLAAPDTESRDQGFDGRRIARVNHGFIVLNYIRYRDKDYKSALRQKRYRDRLKQREGTAE